MNVDITDQNGLDLNFERNSKVTLKASNPTSRVRVLGAGSDDHRPGSLSAAHLVQNTDFISLFASPLHGAGCLDEGGRLDRLPLLC